MATIGVGYQGTPPSAPATEWKPITPHNSNNLSDGPCRAVFVGVGGDVVAVSASGLVATFKNVQSGTHLMVSAARINSTGTTATNLVALY